MMTAVRTAGLLACILLVAAGDVQADGSGDPAAVGAEDGGYFDKDGDPTFKIASDGTVD